MSAEALGLLGAFWSGTGAALVGGLAVVVLPNPPGLSALAAVSALGAAAASGIGWKYWGWQQRIGGRSTGRIIGHALAKAPFSQHR